MLRRFRNLPIVVKAFAAPLVLLFCLIALSAKSYFFIEASSTGLESLSNVKLPAWNSIERLADELHNTQVSLFRYISWLNSGVEAKTLRRTENEIKTEARNVTSKIDQLLMSGNLSNDQHRLLEDVKKQWTKFEELTSDAIEMGAVQPSMAVMMLGEVDDLLGRIQKDTNQVSQSIRLSSQSFATAMVNWSRQNRIVLLGVVAVVIPISMLISIFAALSIVTPVKSVTDAMRRLSSGDTDVEVGYRDRRDEIGQMVEAIKVFRENNT